MTKEEFRERLFDVINESDEIFIKDIEFNPSNGQLHVSVGDGSTFIILCQENDNDFYDTLLDKEQQSMFEKIMDDNSFCQKTECQASFIEGFKVGMKMAMEALKI